MITLTLTAEEQEALLDVIGCCISDLHSQIVHAEQHEFKQMLKDRKQMMLNLMERLKKLQEEATEPA
jgi:hypothetical protein